MNDDKSKLPIEFSAALVVHLVAYLAAGLVATLAGLAASTISWGGLLSPRMRIVIAFGIGLLAGLLVLLLIRRLSTHTPSFTKLDCDFEILEFDVTYTYRVDKTIEYRRRKKLRALKNHLRTYRDRYSWTGSQPPDEFFSGVAHQTVRETGRQTVWRLYEIDLHRTLSKGDTIETEVVWYLNDKDDACVPFVSADIEEPTRQLSFTLFFAPELGVTAATCEVRATLGGPHSLQSEVMTIPPTGSFSWRPKGRPKLLHHYSVEWVFPRRQDPSFAALTRALNAPSKSGRMGP